jgi:hypothetical protein
LTCPIFVHVHQFRRAALLTDPMLRSREQAGNLARHVLAALLTQFPPDSVSPYYYTFIRNDPLNPKPESDA